MGGESLESTEYSDACWNLRSVKTNFGLTNYATTCDFKKEIAMADLLEYVTALLEYIDLMLQDVDQKTPPPISIVLINPLAS